ncbi:hypothetical protein FSP39_012427 [Pinctada imbricata]|uniref:Amine oxidase n=1 Tax=Pinctada imbricata TaxID=66713 RepID=A0AA88Y4I1_PINIB|nr:hypothetical protein FSP39_012427 [Pinctada imbricata]
MKKTISGTSMWKWLTFLFAISTFVFLIMTVTLWVTRDTKIVLSDVPVCGRHRQTTHHGVKIKANSSLQQLTRHEMSVVLDYLYQKPDLNLEQIKDASIHKSFVHTIELKTPRKADVLRFLNGEPPPKREAKVFIFRGDANPPYIGEYVVGPLPNVSYVRLENTTSRVTKVPYIYRPFSSFEFMAIYRYVIAAVGRDAHQVLLESYNATPTKCGDHCLRFSMTPISSAFLKRGERKAWFWFAYDVEFFTLHPLDFQFLVDMTDANPRNWKIEDIWYSNQLFPSMKDFLSNYTCGAINKTRLSFPGENERYKSSLQFRQNSSMLEDDVRPPLLFDQDGPRYTVGDNIISYMAWGMEFKVSPTRGLELFNVRFDKETIVYEMSLQEVAVMYSGYSPTAKLFNYADSAGLFGTRSRGLLPGVDCPAHAKFVDVVLYSANEGGMRSYQNALCVFEQNDNIPLRRHRAYGRIGAFYGGVGTHSLVVRSILSVINYDYIIDYIFYQNGAIETKVSLTGYLGTSFYYPPELKFGAHLGKNLNAGMHLHLFNFKVDLDVRGTENRFETLDIEMINETDPWYGHYHVQNQYTKSVSVTELDAVYKFNFSSPKYLLMSNNRSTTGEGLPRSYQIKATGISRVLLPDDYGFTKSISWSKYQLSFFLLPFNYFDEDQSMRSPDSVRVDPKDERRPTDGATVTRYHRRDSSSCVPFFPFPDDDLSKNSTVLFT